MMKLNYLSLTLRTFALVSHFLARAIHFSTSCVGRDIQKCAGLVCGVFTPSVLLKDDYLCLSPPLECLLRGCGWQPKGQLKAGDHSLPVFLITNVFLEGLCLSSLLELIFLGRVQVFI